MMEKVAHLNIETKVRLVDLKLYQHLKEFYYQQQTQQTYMLLFSLEDKIILQVQLDQIDMTTGMRQMFGCMKVGAEEE